MFNIVQILYLVNINQLFIAGLLFGTYVSAEDPSRIEPTNVFIWITTLYCPASEIIYIIKYTSTYEMYIIECFLFYIKDNLF